MNRLSIFGLLGLVVRRDLLLAMRRRADGLTTLIFFVMVVSLFPLGVGPEPEMLRKMASGVVWSPPCWHRCCRCRACSRRITPMAR